MLFTSPELAQKALTAKEIVSMSLSITLTLNAPRENMAKLIYIILYHRA